MFSPVVTPILRTIEEVAKEIEWRRGRVVTNSWDGGRRGRVMHLNMQSSLPWYYYLMLPPITRYLHIITTKSWSIRQTKNGMSKSRSAQFCEYYVFCIHDQSGTTSSLIPDASSPPPHSNPISFSRCWSLLEWGIRTCKWAESASLPSNRTDSHDLLFSHPNLHCAPPDCPPDLVSLRNRRDFCRFDTVPAP